ncbi:hypothetical protein DM860_016725 [Cuscuta australis]|uniref:Endonuclease/exonuclease/phosphatase domain-containing protein n=1 Tax=Cuscuta australis TaxID=267555 RepID=A0A328DD36_9ASTE|nr:hypothetical protein DM860_016725 [Cuscuta australis]
MAKKKGRPKGYQIRTRSHARQANKGMKNTRLKEMLETVHHLEVIHLRKIHLEVIHLRTTSTEKLEAENQEENKITEAKTYAEVDGKEHQQEDIPKKDDCEQSNGDLEEKEKNIQNDNLQKDIPPGNMDEGFTEIMGVTDQMVSCRCRILGDTKQFLISIVYGHNDPTKRRDLWSDISSLAGQIHIPWCLIGDFNSILSCEDRRGGNPVTLEEIRDFKECIQDNGLEELPSEGARYTWSNKQGQGKRIFSKLDRALTNVEWVLQFNSKVIIKEEGLSDHSPLFINNWKQEKRHTFRFCDMWTISPNFPKIVSEVWDKERQGRPMYILLQKLKELKWRLKKMNKDRFSDIHNRSERLRGELYNIQEAIKKDHDREELFDKEKELIKELNWSLRAGYLMKCQQAKQD